MLKHTSQSIPKTGKNMHQIPPGGTDQLPVFKSTFSSSSLRNQQGCKTTTTFKRSSTWAFKSGHGTANLVPTHFPYSGYLSLTGPLGCYSSLQNIPSIILLYSPSRTITPAVRDCLWCLWIPRWACSRPVARTSGSWPCHILYLDTFTVWGLY